MVPRGPTYDIPTVGKKGKWKEKRSSSLLGSKLLEDGNGGGGLGLLSVDEEARNGAFGVKLDDTGNVGLAAILRGEQPAGEDDSTNASINNILVLIVDRCSDHQDTTIIKLVHRADI